MNVGQIFKKYKHIYIYDGFVLWVEETKQLPKHN